MKREWIQDHEGLSNHPNEKNHCLWEIKGQEIRKAYEARHGRAENQNTRNLCKPQT